MKKNTFYIVVFLAISFNIFAQIDNDKGDKDSLLTKEASGKSEVFIIIYPNEPTKRCYFYLYDFDFELEGKGIDSTDYTIEYEFPEFKNAEVISLNRNCFPFFQRKQKRIKSKSYVTRDELPSIILDSFYSGFYKDWIIEEEREMIQFSEPAVRVYSIRIRKDELQHVLYYAEENGRLLYVKKVKK